MSKIGIIGSGPSGIAAAWFLTQKGIAVELVDVGHTPEPWSVELASRITERLYCEQPPTQEDMVLLRNGLDQTPPSLWQSLTTLLRSDIGAEKVQKRIVGSSFVFNGVEQLIPTTGASVPISLSSGGLSNLWGGACYSLTKKDINEWPFTYSDLTPYYEQAAQLLNLWQIKDGLNAAYPLFGQITNRCEKSRNPGSPLDRLLLHWHTQATALTNLGVAAGKSRLAVTPPENDKKEQSGCLGCGLCFYGCPAGAIFSSAQTLATLASSSSFHYQPGFLASHFVETDKEVLLHGTNPDTGRHQTKTFSTLLLAGGPVSSFKIAAQSLQTSQQSFPVIDNDLYIVPFLMKKLPVAKKNKFRSSFSLSEAAMYLEPGLVASKGVHIQFYTFNEYFLGSLATALEKLPDSWSNIIRSAFNHLVIGFIYFHSDESRQGRISLKTDSTADVTHIDAETEAPSKPLFKATLQYLSKHQKQIGLKPISALAKQTPFGFSGHLGGTLAMKENPTDLQTNANGLLFNCQQVYCVDGATFPTMSAQNPTFTTMANAMRIAEAAIPVKS